MGYDEYDDTGGAGAIVENRCIGACANPRGTPEALLDEFEKSGLSGKKFAVMTGVNYQTFASWMQKRRRPRGDYEKMKAGGKAKPHGKVRWMEAVSTAAPASRARR